MKKFLTLILVLFIFSLFLGEDIIFDGSLTLKYSVDTSPKLTVTTQNNFLYVGIKGDAYFIGFLSLDPLNMNFSIDQAYGIFSLKHATLFLGPKVQNFKVSPLSDDLWLGGTISSEIPLDCGNIYVAIDPNFTDSVDPKVNVLSTNLSFYPLSINAVFYNNFSLLQSGIQAMVNKFKILGYLRYNLTTFKLLNLSLGVSTTVKTLDLTFTYTPDVLTYQGFNLGADVVYSSNENYKLGADIDFDSQTFDTTIKLYSNYMYKDLSISPSITWDSSNQNKISGSLEVIFNF